MTRNRDADAIRLALMMRGSPAGVSLSELEAAFGVSNRSARRLRDAVRKAVPEVIEVDGGDGRKR